MAMGAIGTVESDNGAKGMKTESSAKRRHAGASERKSDDRNDRKERCTKRSRNESQRTEMDDNDDRDKGRRNGKIR